LVVGRDKYIQYNDKKKKNKLKGANQTSKNTFESILSVNIILGKQKYKPISLRLNPKFCKFKVFN